MVEPSEGNLLTADAEALVNTVNCVGFMGKGIALQFKQAFPENFDAYQKACRANELEPGRMLIHETGSMVNPRYIINFPTKRHWRGKSRLKDIKTGLAALVSDVERLGIQSIAIPPLGCGLGGLEWAVVRPLVVEAFAALSDVRVLLYAPTGAPAAKSRPIATKRPKLTIARALFIKLIEQYSTLAYRLTLLEIQKLAYFLQEAGQPLRLQYVEGPYGPYAENLNKVLELLEGHFTSGYTGSRKPDEDIELLPNATQHAKQFLAQKTEPRRRLERVDELIAGFGTPYGMELLASVHWVAKHRESRATTVDEGVKRMHAWSDRKRRMFHADHIRIAWDELQDAGWLD